MDITERDALIELIKDKDVAIVVLQSDGTTKTPTHFDIIEIRNKDKRAVLLS
jgi:hypothetical protein